MRALIDWKVAVIQLQSRVRLFAAPWTAARQTPLSSPISQSLLKFMFIESVMLSNHLILYLNPLIIQIDRIYIKIDLKFP